MQLVQVPTDGRYYDVQAIAIVIGQAEFVQAMGKFKQEIVLQDNSGTLGTDKGRKVSVAHTYKPEHPDMLMPDTLRGIEKTYSVTGKVNGAYTNYFVSDARNQAPIIGLANPQGGQQGGNPAHQEPIQQAMAANNVHYGAPPIGTPLPQDIPSQQSPAPPLGAQSPQTYSPPSQDEPDWDGIARGKVRCAVLCAMLGNSAIDTSNAATMKAEANQYIEYIMTGSLAEPGPDLASQIPYQG